MGFSQYIKQVGHGWHGTRALTRERAQPSLAAVAPRELAFVSTENRRSAVGAVAAQGERMLAAC